MAQRRLSQFAWDVTKNMKCDTKFQDKIVLVTGGTAGIGSACARSFVRRGARVIVVARDAVRGATFAKQLIEEGGNAEFKRVDLRNREDIAELFHAIERDYGRLDVAVNNAGIEGASFTRIDHYPEDVWDDVIHMNLTSVWLCMRKELEIMKRMDRAAIVNIASLAGLRSSLTAGCAYTASKHGLVGLTKSAAIDFARTGIRINAVCPGMVNTDGIDEAMRTGGFDERTIHPIGRICSPDEVADVVCWLSGEESTFITGAAIPVDGGSMAL